MSDILRHNCRPNSIYTEPFSGGAGIALSLLFTEKVKSISVNDLDKAIFSFWYSIVNNTDEFVQKIIDTEVTLEEWRIQRSILLKEDASLLDLGFAAFFLNRTNRSGIISGGVIGGVNQTGNWKIDARYNKDELINRIRKVGYYKSRIMVFNLDAIDVMSKIFEKNSDCFMYIDPPYYNKGSMLYMNHFQHNDHKNLASFLEYHRCKNWIVTYDNTPEILELYGDFKVYTFELVYHSGAPKKGSELLICSDSITLPPNIKQLELVNH